MRSGKNMKITFRIISLILSLVLIVPTFVCAAEGLGEIVFTEIETIDTAEFRYGDSAIPMAVDTLETEINEEFDRYGKLILSQMENSSNLLKAYDLIADGIGALSSKIYLSYSGANISKNEFLTVYNIVLCDYPEYFWTGSSCSYASSFAGNYITYIAPSYIMSSSEAKTAATELEEAVETFTQGLEGKSNYKISKTLHDRISVFTEYAVTDFDQTAYGALIDRKAVCAGYARAYQLLLNSMGIPAWTVTGSSLIPGTTDSALHAWNLVYLDGEWYQTDVTWDDQGSTADYIFYSYFNVTSEQMLEDHTADSDIAPYLPLCTATKNNYFKIKGWECNSFNKTILKNSILSCGGYSRVYLTGDLEEFKAAVSNNIYNIAYEIGIKGSYSYSIMRLGKEIHVVLSSGYPANGDANGDMKVNVKDTLLLKKYLSGAEDITEISLGNADMNSDGRIASTDLMRLRKRISGAAS